MKAGGVAEGHEKNFFAAEADDFGEAGKLIALGAELAEFAETDIRPFRLDDQTRDARDVTETARSGQTPHLRAEGVDHGGDGVHEIISHDGLGAKEFAGERVELRLAASIGEAEAAADLAVAGFEHGVGSEAQAGIATLPVGWERLEERGVARRNEEFEIFVLGIELLQCLFAEVENLFGRRLVVSEETAGDFDGEKRERVAQLEHDVGVDRRKTAEKTFLQGLHLGAKFNELLAAERAAGVGAFLIRLRADRGDLRLGVETSRAAGDRGRRERAVEGDEFVVNSHGKKGCGR
jgi:hypothetical protein